MFSLLFKNDKGLLLDSCGCWLHRNPCSNPEVLALESNSKELDLLTPESGHSKPNVAFSNRTSKTFCAQTILCLHAADLALESSSESQRGFRFLTLAMLAQQ